MNNRSYRKFFKRSIDLVLSVTGIILLLPFGLFLFPLISLSNNGPVFFFQFRPGLNGKPFRFTKFKTMTDRRDSSGKLLPDKFRLTGFGRILRSLSVDEFPQLYNVLKGEMSLVGPRPLLMDYLDLYSKRQARRHEVRPGITGWAQINGRNSVSWEEKFEMDVWYVDNMSFWLDLKILGITLMKVIKRESINSPGSDTMERFKGSGSVPDANFNTLSIETKTTNYEREINILACRSTGNGGSKNHTRRQIP